MSKVFISILCDADPSGFTIAANWCGAIHGIRKANEVSPAVDPLNRKIKVVWTPLSEMDSTFGISQVAQLTEKDVRRIDSLIHRCQTATFLPMLYAFRNEGVKYELDAIKDARMKRILFLIWVAYAAPRKLDNKESYFNSELESLYKRLDRIERSKPYTIIVYISRT